MSGDARAEAMSPQPPLDPWGNPLPFYGQPADPYYGAYAGAGYPGTGYPSAGYPPAHMMDPYAGHPVYSYY